MRTHLHRVRPRTARRGDGFTLLELLVALAIFGIVGVMALSGYTRLQKQSEYTEQRLERTHEVQRAMQTMAQDFSQLEPRPIRQPIGSEYLPALESGESVEYRVEFTRAGWSNTAGLPRPTLQRVAYRFDQDGLWRDHWRVLDRTQSEQAVRVHLLTRVRSVTFRFMTPSRDWSDTWPAVRTVGPATSDGQRARPAAVEITLDLEDWGEISRIIEVSG